MFYECLTGRRPFQGSSNVELMAQITSARPESPSRLRPELSTDHDAVVAKALAKDPAERYATAEELLEDLRGLARGGAISASHDQAPAATVRAGVYSREYERATLTLDCERWQSSFWTIWILNESAVSPSKHKVSD